MSEVSGLGRDPHLIPLCEPYLEGGEEELLIECVRSNWVSSAGPLIDRFEEEVAAAVGRRFGVATASGTAALHVLFRALGIGEQHAVLVSDLTFIAPVNAIAYVGAVPILIDADPEYWQMDPSKLEWYLRQECTRSGSRLIDGASGRHVVAVMPVHVLGHPVDLDRVRAIADEYALMVIEDASESLGGKYRGDPIGSGGIASCLSFNGNKIITTGGGGMVVTDDESLAARIRHLVTQAKTDPIEYIHDEVGFNYRLTNIEAAVGLPQIRTLRQRVERKTEIADRYRSSLGEVPGVTAMREAKWADSAYWMYTLDIDPHEYGIDSRELLARLGRKGIQTRPLWQPMHESQPHGRSPASDCSTASQLYGRCLSLPCSVGLSDDDQERVIEAIHARGV